MQMMVEGDEWEVHIPPEVGFPHRSRPALVDDEAVIIKLEMIEIKGSKVAALSSDRFYNRYEAPIHGHPYMAIKGLIAKKSRDSQPKVL